MQSFSLASSCRLSRCPHRCHKLGGANATDKFQLARNDALLYMNIKRGCMEIRLGWRSEANSGTTTRIVRSAPKSHRWQKAEITDVYKDKH